MQIGPPPGAYRPELNYELASSAPQTYIIQSSTLEGASNIIINNGVNNGVIQNWQKIDNK